MSKSKENHKTPQAKREKYSYPFYEPRLIKTAPKDSKKPKKGTENAKN